MTWCSRVAMYLPLHYTLVLSEKDFQRECRRLALPRDKWPAWVTNEHSDATTHHFVHGSNTRCAVVALRLRPAFDGVQIAALLVHEAVHIWQECKDLIGERNPSAEFEAYSIQGIAQNLMQKYVELTTTEERRP